MSNDFDVNIPQYADEQYGDGLVRIQWRNGLPQSKTGGRFFVAAKRLPDGFTPGEPWQQTTEVFESGDEEEGWTCDELEMLIITHRSQPFQNIGEGRARTTFWLDRWVKGGEKQSMAVDVLVIARGLEELGPVVWSSKTVKTSFAIISSGAKGGEAGIIATAQDLIVKPMSKVANKALDTYCFWVTVGTELDVSSKLTNLRGKPIYVEAGSRKVTRPVLRLPSEVTREYCKSIWAGTEYIRDVLVPLRERYEGWRHERRTNDDAPAPAAAATGGRNVPQVYDESDDVI